MKRSGRDGSAVRLPVSCNKDCGAGCPLLAEVEAGHLLRIRDNPQRHPYMKGCVRGYQMPRIVYSPERLQKPLIRSGPRGSGRFREAGWEEALQSVASRLAEIRDEHGPQAVLHLGGSGSCRGALHNTGLLTRRFLTLFGGFTATVGSYSSGAESFVARYLFGPEHARCCGLDAATLQHTRLILLWGANIVDTRFDCELESRIREQKKRGVPVVAVDPRRSRTVQRLASRWIPVRPGTDTALMAAVLYLLLRDGMVDRRSVERLSVGFAELEAYLLGKRDGRPKDPAWAERICATSQGLIVDLARLYGRSKPAALIPGLSIQRTLGGEEAIRMAVALQTATGNLGALGGSTGGSVWNRLPQPRCASLPLPERPGQPAAPDPGLAQLLWPDRPERLPRPEVPVYLWADAVLDGKAGGYPADIKAIYNVGGNYVATGSDVAKSIRAFESVELAVCHDYFLTPTARCCDVVLPVTTFLEREDIVFPETNHLMYSHRAIDPVGEVRNDYDIFFALADRLGFGKAFSEGKDAAGWIESFLAESEVTDVEEFRRTGIYSGSEQMRSGLSDFAADPQGHPLSTPSGKIEIASRAYSELGFPAYPAWRGFQPAAEYPLYLITPHARYRINSQYANDPWFLSREEQRLWINPSDAEARGIRDGDAVEAASPQGRVRVPARVTEDIMPGVVCLLAGMWPRLAEGGIDSAGAANLLTSIEPTMPSRSSRTHSVGVQIRKADLKPRQGN